MMQNMLKQSINLNTTEMIVVNEKTHDSHKQFSVHSIWHEMNQFGCPYILMEHWIAFRFAGSSIDMVKMATRTVL